MAIGAGAAAVGVPVSGCGGTPHPVLDARSSDDLLARLEARLAAVRSGPAPVSPPWELRPVHEDLLRMGLEALLVTDVVRSIPENHRVEGRLAERLREVLPVLDHCAGWYLGLLETTPPAVRRNIDQRFREEPDTAMDLVSWIDEHGGRLGVSSESRLKLRRAAIEVGSRIRRQSTAAVIDDTVSKVSSQLAMGGADLAALRASTMQALVDDVWAQTRVTEPRIIYHYGGRTRVSQPGTSTVRPPATRASPPSGDDELAIGAALMVGGAAFGVVGGIGLGGGVSVTSAVFAPFAVSATVGAVLVVVGLIVLLVGHSMNARRGT